VGEPGFGSGYELILSLGGHLSAEEDLIFDLACAGQSPLVKNDRLGKERFGGAFGSEGFDQVVVINVELGPVFRNDEILFATKQ
jgi:hypothetical protein